MSLMGGQVDKIVNTTFKWSGMTQGTTGMQKMALGAAAVTTAAVAAGAALWRLSDKTTQIYGQFYDLSQRTGVAASQLHAMSIAAEQDGVGVDSLLMAMRRLPSAIDDMNNGLAASVRSFETIGVTAQELEGLSIEEQFYRVSDALIQVEDESQRAAVAQDLFGRSGMNLLPFLERGSAGMRELADEARATGMVVSDDLYEAADAFQDQLTAIQARIQGVTMQAIAPMLPRLIEMADRLSEIAVDALPDLLRVMELGIPILDGVAWALERVVGGIDGIGAAWSAASDATTSMLDFLGVVSEVPTYSGAMAPGYTPEMAGQLLGGITPNVPGGASDLMGQMGYAEGVLSPFREDVSGVAEELAAANNQAASLATNFSAASEASAEMLDAEQARNELLDHRMQLLEKQQALEEDLAARIAEKQAAFAQGVADAEQAEYDARLERLQNYADMTTQVMGMAWDSLFSNTRASFGDMLKDMVADLVKSGLLNLLRKGIMGGATGGLGFLF